MARGGPFKKPGGKWTSGVFEGLRKKHGLQGPIDDAFMESFVFVTPTGKSANARLDQWVSVEQPRASEFWRRIMRGDARVIKDDAVTDAEIGSSHPILLGGPSRHK